MKKKTKIPTLNLNEIVSDGFSKTLFNFQKKFERDTNRPPSNFYFIDPIAKYLHVLYISHVYLF